MISFSLSGTLESLNAAKTAGTLVPDRIYFVENVGTFIATANNEYKKYNATAELSGLISGLQANKADRDTTANAGQVAKIDADGDAVGTGKTIGGIDKTEFGASGELAVESAVKEYVDDAINTAANGAISGIAFDNATAQISYTPIAGSSTTVSETLSGLVRSFTYSDGKITLTATNGFSETINLPAEQFLAGVAYTQIPSNGVPASGLTVSFKGASTVVPAAKISNAVSGQFGIIFQIATVDDPSTATAGNAETYDYTFVPVEDLVKDYNTSEFTLSEGKLTLNTVPSGKVNAPWNTFATKVGTGHEGKLLTATSDGNLDASTYSITSAKADIEDADTTTVPTAEAVNDFVVEKIGIAGDELIPRVDDATENAVPIFTSAGTLVNSNYLIGGTTSSEFGVSGELAVESAVTGWVADMLSFK